MGGAWRCPLYADTHRRCTTYGDPAIHTTMPGGRNACRALSYRNGCVAPGVARAASGPEARRVGASCRRQTWIGWQALCRSSATRTGRETGARTGARSTEKRREPIFPRLCVRAGSVWMGRHGFGIKIQLLWPRPGAISECRKRFAHWACRACRAGF